MFLRQKKNRSGRAGPRRGGVFSTNPPGPPRSAGPFPARAMFDVRPTSPPTNLPHPARPEDAFFPQ